MESWISCGLLPKGGKLLLGGAAKAGKSHASMSIAYSLATGQPLWGNKSIPVTPAKVLILDKELQEDTLAARAVRYFGRLAGEELDYACDNFTVFTGNPRFKFDHPMNRNVLRDLVAEHRPNVVIIDPVSRFLAGSDSSNDDVQSFIETLDVVRDQFKSDLGLSFIMVHHFAKPESDYRGETINPGSIYRFRGASRWVDDADAIITMQRIEIDGDNHWELKCIATTRHSAGPGEFRLSIRPDTDNPVSFVVQNALQAVGFRGGAGR